MGFMIIDRKWIGFCHYTLQGKIMSAKLMAKVPYYLTDEQAINLMPLILTPYEFEIGEPPFISEFKYQMNKILANAPKELESYKELNLQQFWLEEQTKKFHHILRNGLAEIYDNNAKYELPCDKVVVPRSEEEEKKSAHDVYLKTFGLTETFYSEFARGLLDDAKKRCAEYAVGSINKFFKVKNEKEEIKRIAAVLQNGYCEVTKLPFDFEVPRGPWRPSLDRVNYKNSAYEEGNIQVVVLSYNFLKNQWSPNDVKHLVSSCFSKLFYPIPIAAPDTIPQPFREDYVFDRPIFLASFYLARSRHENTTSNEGPFGLTPEEYEHICKNNSCAATGINFDFSRYLRDFSVSRNRTDEYGNFKPLSLDEDYVPFPTNYKKKRKLSRTPLHYSPWIPSIDRIDSTCTYLKENIQVVTWAFNCAKARWEPEDFKKLIRASADGLGLLSSKLT